jgi:hypothetical protein
LTDSWASRSLVSSILNEQVQVKQTPLPVV